LVFDVEEVETLWIPLPDGCRLAARVWMPKGAGPVPALIEYLPYRRGDGTLARDRENHPWLAARGYACLRIDIRGCGDSDGLFTDEYTAQEQLDCMAAIEWIVAQPWCSGSVGMWGISWGGFNALQVAARRPAALKAIITVGSTDDRYADDTHYMGGCLLLGNLNWGASMLAITSQPPDPRVVGKGWRDIWLKRLAHIPQLVPLWTAHQRRDDYWRQGSVCEDPTAITCAVFAVGGWADAYTNAVPRLLQTLNAPRLGLIGPWAHALPHQAQPGPAIGFLQEALRWWDHWLKGHDTGIMDEPQLRAWIGEPMPPATHYDDWPGRWVGEAAWPHPHKSLTLHAHKRRLTEAAGPKDPPIRIASPQTLGMNSGAWCAYGLPGDLPGDQAAEDGQSVTFDTEPLPDRIELLGAPVLHAEVSADQPCAFLVARLNAVDADGRSTRISYGVLNLTHRDSHATPEPLEPGRRYTIRLQLNDIGQAFAPGQRIRLALSNAYWPTIWPSPRPATVTLHPGCRLDLPTRAPQPADAAIAPFGPPQSAPAMPVLQLRQPDRRRRAEIDLTDGSITVTAGKDWGATVFTETGFVRDGEGIETYGIRRDDPLTARGEVRRRTTLRLGDWQARTETLTVQTATEDAFLITSRLDAWDGERRIFSHAWTHTIKRDLV
jgi:putative CocE/NonD family hydrolase